MPIFRTRGGKYNTRFTREEMSRLMSALQMAGQIDTTATPETIADADDQRVPAYKLVPGAWPKGLSPDECRHLATVLWALIPKVIEGEVGQVDKDQLDDLKAKYSEFLGEGASFVPIDPLPTDQWEALMNKFQAAIGWASGDEGLVVEDSP